MTTRPAATLALLRDSDQGLQVLLLQRSWRAAFMPGFFVFAGGAVEPEDASVSLTACVTGSDDADMSRLLDVEQGGLSYALAAVRECFEECGLLLACDPSGAYLPATPASEGQSLADLCQQQQLQLPIDRLAYMAHWVTPPQAPRRFDTRFFVALAPGQTVQVDGREIIDHVWISPQQALDDHLSGRRLIAVPTVKTLRLLNSFCTADEAIRYARSQPPETFPTEPWPAQGRKGPVLLEPGAPAYDEVRKLDPQRSGQCAAEMRVGALVQLAEGVRRITAPNGSVMTGPGTNTYLIGLAPPYAVIDPGPDHPGHRQRILDATAGKISHLLVTHTHRDHSPGALALKVATGACLVGLPAPDDGFQDAGFVPDLQPQDGQLFSAGGAGGLKLRAIATPGHASNHLCYLLEGAQADARILFSGDHIMQGATVVINPPDGDMAAYVASLARLLSVELAWIAPGHGFLMRHPHGVIDYLISHRMAREHKVLHRLRQSGPVTLEALLPLVYDDVPRALHKLAARSLLAHLIKLGRQQKAICEESHWSVCSI